MSKKEAVYFDKQEMCYRLAPDIDTVIKANEKLKLENDKFRILLSNKILLVEDGSVDIDKLEEDGFYVICYRQGSRAPMWLEEKEEEIYD
jgi:regulator of replication initiation timing